MCGICLELDTGTTFLELALSSNLLLWDWSFGICVGSSRGPAGCFRSLTAGIGARRRGSTVRRTCKRITNWLSAGFLAFWEREGRQNNCPAPCKGSEASGCLLMRLCMQSTYRHFSKAYGFLQIATIFGGGLPYYSLSQSI